jgi:pyridoxamine 5'-phosphate oxidase
MKNETIANLRVDYSLKKFDEEDLIRDPFLQFSAWFEEALSAQVNEPNAMTLATVKADGTPSARIVLLKGVDQGGFVFFTNYDSAKGHQLQVQPHVAIVFCWLELQRQVRIEGVIEKITPAESDAYFFSRPLGSQIGAHASPQSQVLSDRQALETTFEQYKERFSHEPLFRPANWGGYRIKPRLFEFWQGRQSRLHDRFLFEIQTDKVWNIHRLAP